MFTGIIQGRGTVVNLEDLTGLRRLTIELPIGTEQNLATGASIAVDGVCLTVTNHKNRLVSFDAMQETLTLTTLGKLKVGDFVNIERSMQIAQEIGGHTVSGHVDCLAEIIAINKPQNNWVITFSVPKAKQHYIFSKGFIALNGASLTVTNYDHNKGTFEVWLIPETLKLTTFGDKQIGDMVNLEVERNTQVIVDSVWRFLKDNFSQLNTPLS